jgi:16S rRNA processing protein RimM
MFFESKEIISNLKFVNDENGEKLFDIEHLAKHKNLYLVKLVGIDSRNDSDLLRGTYLYVNEDILPELEEDEFFTGELQNLKVKDSEGKIFGIVKNVFNFGAGDVLEIVKNTGDYYMLSFNKNSVPVVDIENGFIVINENLAISNRGDLKCTQ